MQLAPPADELADLIVIERAERVVPVGVRGEATAGVLVGPAGDDNAAAAGELPGESGDDVHQFVAPALGAYFVQAVEQQEDATICHLAAEEAGRQEEAEPLGAMGAQSVPDIGAGEGGQIRVEVADTVEDRQGTGSFERGARVLEREETEQRGLARAGRAQYHGAGGRLAGFHQAFRPHRLVRVPSGPFPGDPGHDKYLGQFDVDPPADLRQAAGLQHTVLVDHLLQVRAAGEREVAQARLGALQVFDRVAERDLELLAVVRVGLEQRREIARPDFQLLVEVAVGQRAMRPLAALAEFVGQDVEIEILIPVAEQLVDFARDVSAAEELAEGRAERRIAGIGLGQPGAPLAVDAGKGGRGGPGGDCFPRAAQDVGEEIAGGSGAGGLHDQGKGFEEVQEVNSHSTILEKITRRPAGIPVRRRAQPSLSGPQPGRNRTRGLDIARARGRLS